MFRSCGLHRVLESLAIVFCFLGLLLARASAAKLPVPGDAAQAEALKLAKEVLGEEFAAAKTPEAKKALAEKMLRMAAESKNDPAAHFVLLKLAGDIAALGGEAETALRAVDAIAAHYEIDPHGLKVAALLTAARSASLPEQYPRMVDKILAVVELAVARDEFQDAIRLGEAALSVARKTRDGELVRSVLARTEEVAEIAQAYETVAPFFARLEEQPSDPQANLMVGKYLCFTKGDWEKGIPMLALGNDPALKDLAARELQGASDSAGCAALGDGWWDLAEKWEEADRDQARRRAAYWYKRALPGLAGLMKERVKRRLDELSGEEEASGDGSNTTRRPTMRARIFATCDDSFELYVNGEPVLSGKPGGRAMVRDYSFARGDVITVRCRNIISIKGFCCIILFEKRPSIVTPLGWRGYQPKSEKEWFKPENIAEPYPLVPGDNADCTNTIKKACGIAPLTIWGRGNVCYLFYIVR